MKTIKKVLQTKNRFINTAAAVLVLAGNIFSQALSAYEKKVMDLQLEYSKGVISVKTKYATTLPDYAEITRLTQSYNALVATPDSKSKADKVDNFKSQLVLSTLPPLEMFAAGLFGLVPPSETVKMEEFNKLSAKLEKDIKAAESLANSTELKKLRDEKYGRRYFYFSNKEDILEGTNKKGEFETTNDYNKRLNDSTDYYLKTYALKKTKEIAKKIIKEPTFRFGDYNADKGVYTVKAYLGPKYELFGGDTIKGIMPISPQEAKALESNLDDYYTVINPTDVFLNEYFLYPSKISLVSTTDPSKKYTATFPKPSGATDIMFRGSEIWADNPKAVNIVYSYKEVFARWQAAEQQRTEQKRAEEQRIQAEQQAKKQAEIQRNVAKYQEGMRTIESELQRVETQYQGKIKQVLTEYQSKRQTKRVQEEQQAETNRIQSEKQAEIKRIETQKRQIEAQYQAETNRIQAQQTPQQTPMAKIEYYRTEVKRITDEYNSRKLSYNEYVTKLDWIKERIEAEVRYIETQQTPTTKMEYYIAEAKRVQDKYDKKMINSYEYNKEYERIANRIKAEEYEAEIERVSMELNIGKLTYPQCKAEIKRIETEYKYKESVFSYLFCKNCYYDY